MESVFHRNMRTMFQNGHTSVSLVLSILQLISQKSQHPRSVSLREIDVVKQIGAVDFLERPNTFVIRKCIRIPWVVYIVLDRHSPAKRSSQKSVLRVIIRN